MNKRTQAFFLPAVLIVTLLVALLLVGLPQGNSPDNALAAENDLPVDDEIIAQNDDDVPVVTVEVTVEVTRIVTVVVTPTHTPLPPTPTPLPPDITTDDDDFIGQLDAPVKVVEFSDYRCGFCRRFYDETLFRLTARYGDLIQFVYRDFPIFGDPSFNAAAAAECGGEQDAFWEFHNAIFEDQLNAEPMELTQENLSNMARSLELDVDDWNVCFESEEIYNEVIFDAITASEWGVTGTPTFFINGRAIVGAQPYEVFVQLIDAELIAAGIDPPTGDEG